MGFVSEQECIGEDQVGRCERRNFVVCVPISQVTVWP
jgi:hypothetical protein